MKIHGSCRWCHHAKYRHQGKNQRDIDFTEAQLKKKIRWLKYACSIMGCPCRSYEV